MVNKDCTDTDEISVDQHYTMEKLCAVVAAHEAGAIDIEKEFWFGHKDDYYSAPKTHHCLVRKTNE